MSRSYRHIIFAFALAVSYGVSAQEVAQEYPIEDRAAQEQTAQQAPPVPEPVPPVAPAEPPATEHDPTAKNDGDASPDDSLFWGDGIAQWAMAITSVLALFVSAWAVWLLRETLDATREAVRQAEEGTKAAQEATNVTREMGQAQVRAYVSWNGANIGAKLDESAKRIEGLTFIPMIKNTGQSPARLTNLYSHLCRTKPEEKATIDFDIANCAVSDELGAGAPFEMADHWLGMQNAVEIFRGESRAFLLGWGSYRSVFSAPEDPDHIFKFCFEIGFRTLPNGIPLQHLRANVILHSRPDYHIAPIIQSDDSEANQ